MVTSLFAASEGFGNTGPAALALSAGVLTAFNPCGFAMLPAYVSYFVGQSGDRKMPLPNRLVKAATVGLVVTLGFITVFGVIGVAASTFIGSITDYVPYISMGVGAVLFVLGIAMLRGFELKLNFLKVNAAKQGAGLSSMYAYGLSYAVVSLSCGFGGFSAAVISSTREKTFLSRLSLYFLFAAGMGLVLLMISFAVALAQQAVVKGMRKLIPYINRASGVLLILTGLYVAYYGYYEYKTLIKFEKAPQGPVGWVTSWSTSTQRFFGNLSTTTLTIGLLLVAAITATSIAFYRRGHTDELPTDLPTTEFTAARDESGSTGVLASASALPLAQNSKSS